jgi:hypothetical protein
MFISIYILDTYVGYFTLYVKFFVAQPKYAYKKLCKVCKLVGRGVFCAVRVVLNTQYVMYIRRKICKNKYVNFFFPNKATAHIGTNVRVGPRHSSGG